MYIHIHTYTHIEMATNSRQCACYKSKKQTDERCPNRAQFGSPYCGTHKACQVRFDQPSPSPSPSPSQPLITLKPEPSHPLITMKQEPQKHEPQIRPMITMKQPQKHEPQIRPMITMKQPMITLKPSSQVETHVEEPSISHISKRISLNRLMFDVVKSGLQKAIRRGDEKALSMAYAIEGDLYSLVVTSGTKGNRTNLANRLRIILVEDLFNARSIPVMEDLFTKWEHTRETLISRNYLVNIVHFMTQSKKIRLVSDLKVFMLREDHRRVLGTEYDDLFNGWNDYPDPSEQVNPLDRYLYLLGIKNPNCLYWYQQLGQPINMWSHLIKLADISTHHPHEIKSLLKSLMMIQRQLPEKKVHDERYLYVMFATAIFLFEDLIDWNCPSVEFLGETEVNRLYEEHRKTWTPSNLPYPNVGWLPEEVVVDKHTAKGLAHGKNSLDFATVGSMVNNQDSTFFFSRLREIYIKKKQTEVAGEPRFTQLLHLP